MSLSGNTVESAGHNEPEKGNRAFVACLVVIALAAVCYFARAIMIPMVAAVLLYLLFNPSVRKLKKWGCPRPVSSSVIVILVSVVLVYAFSALVVSMQDWTESAPETMEQLEEKLTSIREPVAAVEEAAKALEDATSSESAIANPQLQVKESKAILPVIFDASIDVIIKLITCLGLTFFLLLSGETLIENLSRYRGKWGQGKNFGDIFRKMESDVSRYLIIRSLINLVLALIMWGLLTHFEHPNALMLAITIGLLNYIPYLGPLVGFFIVGAATLIMFGVEEAIKLGVIYFILQTIEGMIVSPWMMGDMLRLNPIVVFVAILIGGWMWGVAGAIMAVPILSAIYIISEDSEKLELFALILGQTPSSAKTIY